MEVWLAEGDAWKLLSALLKARYGLPALPRVCLLYTSIFMLIHLLSMLGIIFIYTTNAVGIQDKITS